MITLFRSMALCMLVGVVVFTVYRWIILRSLQCALGFHDWDNKIYDSSNGLCIVCKKCPTADFSLGV